jgi:tetratricopeptide (TPR) repeat protein
MPEPERLETLAASDPAVRDSRAEALLVEGLDQYFAGKYEDAIHLWTRVLFLDRTHSRARAYIDRARTALAERQRRAEELLEASYELLGQGRTTAARHLFNEVVAEAGEDERASALRMKLERLEQFERLSVPSLRSGTPKPDASSVGTRALPAPAWRGVRPVPLVFGVAVLALAAGILFGPDVRAWLGLAPVPSDLAIHRPTPAPAPLSTSEVALIRAKTAFSRGRLSEALQALDRVSADSPVFTEADQLRVRIQQTLIASTTNRSRTEARFQ